MDTVIQFSPIRSGSTMVYNAIRLCLPEATVIKTHNLKNKADLYTLVKDDLVPMVVTFRHPIDSVVSSVLRYEKLLTAENLLEAADEVKANGLRELPLVVNRPNTLILRYEAFYGKPEMVLCALSDFFNLNIDNIGCLAAALSIEKAVETAAGFDDFYAYDTDTQIHGNHVSPYKGRPGYSRDVLAEDLYALLQGVLGDEINDYHRLERSIRTN